LLVWLLTDWNLKLLGISSDPKHKSHKIAIADDVDPSQEVIEEDKSDHEDEDNESFFGDGRLEARKLEKVKERLPTAPCYHNHNPARR
jgi:hypothetical protein